MSIDDIRMQYLIAEPTLSEVTECIDLYWCWRDRRVNGCMSALRSYRPGAISVAMNRVNGTK
jgi:hypothetical protein